MATGNRSGESDLTHLSRLESEPWAHHLFHAIRVIEAAHPEAPRIGMSSRPSQDPVRLGQEPAMSFPVATIASYKPAAKGRPSRLINRMFGLFGPQGPLPLHLTEYARDRTRNSRDTTFTAFADMLTHRFASLFYRAWAAGQPAVSFDNPAGDQFGEQVDALAGQAGPALVARDAMPDLAKRFFAGHLAAGAKSAGRLQAVLSVFLGAPVRVQEFVGSWLHLEPDDCWHLGAGPTLGRGTVLGRSVWSRADKFRIFVGPLTYQRYVELLPGGARLAALDATIRNLVGDRLDWDINLILRSDEAPRLALDGSVRLGHTSWIGMRRTHASDANDLFFSTHANRSASGRSAST